MPTSGVRTTFPLPKGYFDPLVVTAKEEDEYRRIVQAQVNAALREEHEFVYVRENRVDESQWRQVRQKHHFQIFRRKKRTIIARGDREPSMLGFGQLKGTTSDILFGCYDESHEELQASKAFISDGVLDSTVLHTIDTATPEDPFRYLGVKWMLTKVPVLRARDLCYIDAMGQGHDPHGNPFAYLVMHSINIANCPPFHRSAAIRAEVFFSFIFREHVDGIVDVFAQGYFDAAGEMTQRFSTIATAEILSGVLKSVQCGEAKKLTLMAMMNAKDNYSETNASGHNLQQCSGCKKKSNVFKSLKTCRVCHDLVCKNCSAKKFIFGGGSTTRTVSKVTCCPSCVVKAKNLMAGPTEGNFASGTYQLSTSSATDDGDESVGEKSSMDIGDYVGADSGGFDGYDTDGDYERCSGLSEDEVEAVIQMMLQQKLVAKNNESHSLPAPPEPATFRQAALCAPASAQIATASTLDQSTIYQQLVALQHKTKEVSAITRANHKVMKSTC